jgi:hypothetical protein
VPFPRNIHQLYSLEYCRVFAKMNEMNSTGERLGLTMRNIGEWNCPGDQEN